MPARAAFDKNLTHKKERNDTSPNALTPSPSHPLGEGSVGLSPSDVERVTLFWFNALVIASNGADSRLPPATHTPARRKLGLPHPEEKVRRAYSASKSRYPRPQHPALRRSLLHQATRQTGISLARSQRRARRDARPLKERLGDGETGRSKSSRMGHSIKLVRLGGSVGVGKRVCGRGRHTQVRPCGQVRTGLDTIVQIAGSEPRDHARCGRRQ